MADPSEHVTLFTTTFSLAPGAPLHQLVPGYDNVIVALSDGTLRNEAQTGAQPFGVGAQQPFLMPWDEPYVLRNVGDKPVKVLVIELRTDQPFAPSENVKSVQQMKGSAMPCNAPSSSADERQRCFINASNDAERIVKDTYSRFQKVLSLKEQKDLEQAQRLWVQFRDANCAAERNLYGSEKAPTAYAACVYSDTQKRIIELNTMYGGR